MNVYDSPDAVKNVESNPVLITPKWAEELLSLNKANYRKLRPVDVKKYKGAMKRGEWRLNGDTITVGFNKFGEKELKDGQHRLQACIESGVSFPVILVEGVSQGVEDTIDFGVKRSFGDMLRRRGEVNVTTLAATIKQIGQYELGVGIAGTISPRLTPQQLMKVFERHPGIRETLSPPGADFLTRLITSSSVGSLNYLFHLVDPTDAQAYFNILANGGVEAGNPILSLRERLVKNTTKTHHRMSPRVRAALAIKAFNYWRDGREVLQLTWKPGGAAKEPFPVIEGCPIGIDTESGNIQIPAAVQLIPSVIEREAIHA